MKKILFLVAATSLFVACSKAEDKDKVYNSEKIQVHGGKAWSSLTLDAKGQPKQFAIVLDDAVLNSVPSGPGNGDHMSNTFLVPVPAEAKQSTPFKFLMLNWNPEGHEPEHIYTVPHFDLHYYLTTKEEVMGYTDTAKLNADPAPGYVPANHIGAHPLPMMGKHWIDVTSPELDGTTAFTQTFIYGSYDSKIVFYEPMITLNFLKQNGNYERSLPQPAKFKTGGFYPTRLKIKKQNGTTEIILDGFVERQAS